MSDQPDTTWWPNLQCMQVNNLAAKFAMKSSATKCKMLWWPQSIEQKSSCFRRAFNESHPTFAELSTKLILLSESSWRDCFRRTCFFTIFSVTTDMVKFLHHHSSEELFRLAESQPTSGTLARFATNTSNILWVNISRRSTLFL